MNKYFKPTGSLLDAQIEAWYEQYPRTDNTWPTLMAAGRDVAREVFNTQDAIKDAQNVRYRGGSNGQQFIDNCWRNGYRSLEQRQNGAVKINVLADSEGHYIQIPKNLLAYVRAVVRYVREEPRHE